MTHRCAVEESRAASHVGESYVICLNKQNILFGMRGGLQFETSERERLILERIFGLGNRTAKGMTRPGEGGTNEPQFGPRIQRPPVRRLLLGGLSPDFQAVPKGLL